MTDSKTESQLLIDFFSSEICQKATRPLKNGIEIGVYIDGSEPLTLTKQKGTITLVHQPPQKADMSFWIGKQGVKTLVSTQTEDIGEIGVAIIKLMLSSDPETRLRSQVHIGTLQLITHGYLGVLPLGGPTVMKFLASKGFSNISKIKEAISQLRG